MASQAAAMITPRQRGRVAGRISTNEKTGARRLRDVWISLISPRPRLRAHHHRKAVVQGAHPIIDGQNHPTAAGQAVCLIPACRLRQCRRYNRVAGRQPEHDFRERRRRYGNWELSAR